MKITEGEVSYLALFFAGSILQIEPFLFEMSNGPTLLWYTKIPGPSYKLEPAGQLPHNKRRIGEIIAGKRAITTNTGLRPSRFFGLSDGFWERLQIDYDLAVAKDEMAETLNRIKPYAAA